MDHQGKPLHNAIRGYEAVLLFFTIVSNMTVTTNSHNSKRVWNLLTGTFDLDIYVPPEAKHVRNEWEKDDKCATLWQSIYVARTEIARRLGDVIESPDLLRITESSAYTDRQRKELEGRVSAAVAQLCDRYGIASDSPEMQALTDAYRAMIAMTEASAYAQGVAWGINEKKPPASR